MSVFVNGKSVVHQGDGLVFTAMAPDVCKTPSPGGPVPIPYPNIAMSSDLSDGTRNVKVQGNPTAIETSNIKMSTGDEAGSAGGGVVSNKIKGKVTWLLYSMDVQFEGKGVVRFLDDNMHNGNAGNTSGKNLGMAYPGHDDPTGKIVCDNCGKPLNSPGHPQLKSSTQSTRAAEKEKGRTTSGLIISCKDSRTATFGASAGGHGVFNPNSFKALAKNFKSKKPIPPQKDTDDPPAGNCAEQKALYAAFAAGALPLRPGCEASLSTVREKRGGGKQHVPACNTCKRVLTSMLCENEPKKD